MHVLTIYPFSPSAWSGLRQTSALLPYRHCWIQRPFPWCPNRSPNSCHGDKVPAAVNIRPMIFCSFINSSCAIYRLIAFISAPSDTQCGQIMAILSFHHEHHPSLSVRCRSIYTWMHLFTSLKNLCAPLTHTHNLLILSHFLVLVFHI